MGGFAGIWGEPDNCDFFASFKVNHGWCPLMRLRSWRKIGNAMSNPEQIVRIMPSKVGVLGKGSPRISPKRRLKMIVA